MFRPRFFALVVPAAAFLGCASSSPEPLGLATSAVVAVDVQPAYQEAVEGESANWSGTATFGQGTDGSPSEISWDFDEDGFVDSYVCGGYVQNCASHCTQGDILGDDEITPPNPYLFGYGATLAGTTDLDMDGEDDVVFAWSGGYYGGTYWRSFLSGGEVVSGQIYYAPEWQAGVVGDVTADGIPDLVVTQYQYYGNGSGMVYEGDGTGSFSQQNSFSFGNRSAAIALGDLNGDGFNEVATDNHHQEVIGGFLTEVNGILIHASASGTLVPLTSADGPYEAEAIAFADVGGDGQMDVLGLSGNGGAFLRVYRGDGTGTLADTTEEFVFPAPMQAYTSFLAAADLDGDGKPEAIAATNDPNNINSFIALYPGAGSSFGPETGWSFAGAITALQVADADGDGDPDVLVTFLDGVLVLRTDGPGVFTQHSSAGLPSYATVAVSDTDADGLPDLRGLVPQGNLVLPGLGAGDFGRPMTPVLGSPRGFAKGDFNQDGALDLVTTSQPGGTSILLGNGTGGFTRTDLAVSGLSVVVADMNADLHSDLVIGSATSLVILLGNGAGGFAQSASYAEGALSVAVADFNEDGKLDVTYATVDGLFVRQGDGAGLLLATTNLSSIINGCPGERSCAVAATDFTRDGHADIAWASRWSFAGTLHQELRILGGNGAGAFPSGGQIQNYPTYPVGKFDLIATDIVGDAEPDLVVLQQVPRSQVGNGISDWPDYTTIFENKTGGGLPLVYFDSVTGTDFAAGAGDVSGDGRGDLVVGDSWANVYVQHPSQYYPSSVFEASYARSTGMHPEKFLVGDFDGDGWNDIASANGGSNSVTLIRGSQPTWSCPINGNYSFQDVGAQTPRLDIVTTEGTTATHFDVLVTDSVPTLSYIDAYDSQTYGAVTEGRVATVRFYPSTNYADPVTRCDVDFGDGSPLVFEPCNSPTIFEHVFPDGDPTDVPLTITFYDEDGSATAPAFLTVANAAPVLLPIGTVSAVEGAPVSIDSAITDVPDDADWVLEWDLDYDGNLFVADTTGSASAPGAIGITRSFDEGSYAVALRVTDQAGLGNALSAVTTGSIVVADSEPALGAILSGSPVIQEATPVSLTLSVAANAFDAVTSCTWSFGDGTPDELDPGCAGMTAGTTSRTHSFPDGDPTSFTVSVTVADEDGTTVASQPVTVVNAAPVTTAGPVAPAAPAEGQSASVDVTIAESVQDANYRVEWSWGDGSTDVTTVPAPGTYSLAHVYRDDAPYTFTARVIDQADAFGVPQTGSALASASLPITVSNAPPALAAVSTQDAVEGSLFLYSLSAIDPGASDVLSFSLASGPSGLNVLPTGTVAWVPSYAQAGGGAGQSHLVSVSVADGDGGVDGGTFNVRVRWKDDDADGMADTWEVAHGMDPTIDDSLGDADGDGIVNINEFNGTGPFTPNVVELSAPADGTEVASTDPSLVAVNTSDPDSASLIYVFQVFSDQTLTTPVLQASAVGGTNGTTTLVVDDLTTDAGAADDDSSNSADAELADDASYWWRARAFDGTFYGPWSPARRFSYQPVNDAPGLPAIASPLIGSQVSSTTPLLIAGNALDPDDAPLEYRYRVYSDPARTQQVADSGIVPEGTFGTTSWLIAPPLADDTPYWWTASVTDGVSTTTLTTGAFSVNLGNNEPSAPAIVSPVSGATVADVIVDLVSAQANDPDPGQTLAYLFELDVSPTFNTPAASSCGPQAGTTCSVAGLLEDTTYWWRVRAHDGLSAGDWTLGTFRVNTSNGAPSIPVTLGPGDGALIDDVTPVLRARNAVDPEGGVLTYTFEIREGSSDGDVVATGTSPEGEDETSFAIPDTDALQRGETYYWTLHATDSESLSGAESAPAAFAVFKASGGGGGGGGCGVAGGSARGSVVMLLLAVALVRRRQRCVTTKSTGAASARLLGV